MNDVRESRQENSEVTHRLLSPRMLSSLGILLALVGGAVAYASISTGTSAPGRTSTGNMAGPTIAASCVSNYSSVATMAGASEDVITGVVLPGSTVDFVDGVPFTVTSVQVKSVLKGSLGVGSTVQLRQLGPGAGDAEPIVHAGSTALLFVVPFQWSPTQPVAGEYVALGCGQGLYEATTSQSSVFQAMSASGLPASLTAADAVSAISSSPGGS